MRQKLKIGLDIHGVIDTYPEKFKMLSCALVQYGAEVHVITGVKRDAGVDKLLTDAGIQFTHFFSIVEHLEETNETIEWIDGLPYADETKWNLAKRDYCDAHVIDMMIDDSAIYRETFNDINTTFLQVINA